MELRFIWLLLALALSSGVAVAGTASLRGSTQEGNDDTIVCRVILFDTVFDDGTESEDLFCIPMSGTKESYETYSLKLPQEFSVNHESAILEGKLYVSIGGAYLSDEEKDVKLKPNAAITVVDPFAGRWIAQEDLDAIGRKTLFIVRISTIDSTPTPSISDLEGLFSEDRVSFKTQFSKCSFGQLEWSSNGVVDVTVNKPVATYMGGPTALVFDALDELAKQRYFKTHEDLADKVFFCLPPGTGNWAASAGIAWWRAQFNDQWCTSLSGTMHEMGHCLGLSHSALAGSAYDYGDTSGMMGWGTMQETAWPAKCYNGLKSWKLGWYKSRHLAVDPFKGGQLVRLATFVDYDKAQSNQAVVINIGGKYFLQYNRAKEFNIDTQEFVDQVTITEHTGYASHSHGGLSVGGLFHGENYEGSGFPVSVHICQSVPATESTPEYMLISIGLAHTLCGTTEAPSRQPSIAPSPIPSSMPSQLPTVMPSFAPSGAPTVQRTQAPTASE